jgi:enamine deaminase RidA (YjgF/YER057c/UK114 family)
VTFPSKIKLPVPPDPVGSYDAGIVRKGTGYISGQFPFKDGELLYQGRVGLELTYDQGSDACELAALNVLAQVKRLTNQFETLDGLLRMEGYVASSDDYLTQALILNRASDLFIQVLGERGRHARTVYAVPRLPMNASIELAVSFSVIRP